MPKNLDVAFTWIILFLKYIRIDMCQIIQKGEICMKHMTLNDRISIQEGLDNGYAIRTITPEPRL